MPARRCSDNRDKGLKMKAKASIVCAPPSSDALLPRAHLWNGLHSYSHTANGWCWKRLKDGGAEAALKRRIRLRSDSPPVCSARQQCLGLLISLWFNLGSCRAEICILHNKAFRWYVSDEHIFWVRQQKFGTIWCHCTTDRYGKCKAQLCVKLFILAG